MLLFTSIADFFAGIETHPYLKENIVLSIHAPPQVLHAKIMKSLGCMKQIRCM